LHAVARALHKKIRVCVFAFEFVYALSVFVRLTLCV
jgi:hypothetical protein